MCLCVLRLPSGHFRCPGFAGVLLAPCIFILEITRITRTGFLSKRNLGEISFGGVSGVCELQPINKVRWKMQLPGYVVGGSDN